MATPFDEIADPFNLTGWDSSRNDANYAMAQQFLNRPLPPRPKYQKGYDASMNISGKFDPNMAGINAYRAEALRTGPSKGATLAQQQQNMLAMDARGKSAQDVAGSSAQARSQLAMHGGLSGGASERVAKQGSRDLLSMNQNTANQRMGAGQQIAMDDEKNRISQLGALPGMENQAMQMPMQAAMFDTTNKFNETGRQNAFNMNNYASDMKGYENAQQAGATLGQKQKNGMFR